MKSPPRAALAARQGYASPVKRQRPTKYAPVSQTSVTSAPATSASAKQAVSPLLRVSPRLREAHRQRWLNRKRKEEELCTSRDMGVNCNLFTARQVFEDCGRPADPHVQKQNERRRPLLAPTDHKSGPRLQSQHGGQKGNPYLYDSNELAEGNATFRFGPQVVGVSHLQPAAQVPQPACDPDKFGIHRKIENYSQATKAVEEDFHMLSRSIDRLAKRVADVVLSSGNDQPCVEAAPHAGEAGRPRAASCQQANSSARASCPGTAARLEQARRNYRAVLELEGDDANAGAEQNPGRFWPATRLQGRFSATKNQRARDLVTADSPMHEVQRVTQEAHPSDGTNTCKGVAPALSQRQDDGWRRPTSSEGHHSKPAALVDPLQAPQSQRGADAELACHQDRRTLDPIRAEPKAELDRPPRQWQCPTPSPPVAAIEGTVCAQEDWDGVLEEHRRLLRSGFELVNACNRATTNALSDSACHSAHSPRPKAACTEALSVQHCSHEVLAESLSPYGGSSSTWHGQNSRHANPTAALPSSPSFCGILSGRSSLLPSEEKSGAAPEGTPRRPASKACVGDCMWRAPDDDPLTGRQEWAPAVHRSERRIIQIPPPRSSFNDDLNESKDESLINRFTPQRMYFEQNEVSRMPSSAELHGRQPSHGNVAGDDDDNDTSLHVHLYVPTPPGMAGRARESEEVVPGMMVGYHSRPTSSGQREQESRLPASQEVTGSASFGSDLVGEVHEMLRRVGNVIDRM